MIDIPDGLQLLFMAFLLRQISKSTLNTVERRCRCRLLPLKRVQLIDRLRLHRRRSVIVTNRVLSLLRLYLRQSVPTTATFSGGYAPISISVRRHLDRSISCWISTSFTFIVKINQSSILASSFIKT